MDAVTLYAYERIMKREDEASRSSSGCLLWPGATAGVGYGKVLRSKDENTTLLVHRVVFAVSVGMSVDDLEGEVLHSCDVPPCFEVSHLSNGTHLENMREMVERGRGWWRKCRRCWRLQPCPPECAEQARQRKRALAKERYALKTGKINQRVLFIG